MFCSPVDQNHFQYHHHYHYDVHHHRHHHHHLMRYSCQNLQSAILFLASTLNIPTLRHRTEGFRLQENHQDNADGEIFLMMIMRIMMQIAEGEDRILLSGFQSLVH